jgi:hypothetical protein
MPSSRREDPWVKQAARGVGFVVGLGLAVLAAGAIIAFLFALVMGSG